MSSVTGNHAMDLLYLLKDTFKNLLFDLLIIGRTFENLPYLSKCSLSRRWRFWRIRSNVLWGIKSGLAYAKVSGVNSQKYRRSPRKSIGGHLAKVSAVTSQKYRRSPRKSIGGHLAKVLGVTSQYILWSGSLWYSGRSSMLKNKRIFSLVVSELMPAFSTVQLHVGKNHIN